MHLHQQHHQEMIPGEPVGEPHHLAVMLAASTARRQTCRSRSPWASIALACAMVELRCSRPGPRTVTRHPCDCSACHVEALMLVPSPRQLHHQALPRGSPELSDVLLARRIGPASTRGGFRLVRIIMISMRSIGALSRTTIFGQRRMPDVKHLVVRHRLQHSQEVQRERVMTRRKICPCWKRSC